MSTDWRPNGPGMPSRDDRSPDARGKYNTMMYFPFPVTPDLKKQTFTRVAEEVTPGYIRAGAVPKFGMSPTAMRRLCLPARTRCTGLWTSSPEGSTPTSIKGTRKRVEVKMGVSKSQQRRGATFRAYYTILTKPGYTKKNIIQRYTEGDGSWKNIVLLAQKGGRVADFGRSTRAFDGLRAYFGPGSVADPLAEIVANLGNQV